MQNEFKGKKRLQNEKQHINNRLMGWALDHTNYNSNTFYTPIPHKLLYCKCITTTARLLLIKLFIHFGENEYCYPSQETISNDLGVSQGTVSNAIDLLVEKGFITIEKADGGNYIYRIGKLENNPHVLLGEALYYFKKNIRIEPINRNLIKSKVRWLIKETLKSEMYMHFVNDLKRSSCSSNIVIEDFLRSLLWIFNSETGINALLDLEPHVDYEKVKDSTESEQIKLKLKDSFSGYNLSNGLFDFDTDDFMVCNWDERHFIEFFKMSYDIQNNKPYYGNDKEDYRCMLKLYKARINQKEQLFYGILKFLIDREYNYKTIKVFTNPQIQASIDLAASFHTKYDEKDVDDEAYKKSVYSSISIIHAD